MKKIFSFLCASALALAARLVVLDPAAVEILDAIGAKDQILAIAPPSSFDIRADVSKIPSVGSYMKPNIEQIYALQPDIVLASRHSLASAKQLENLGIKMQVIDANSHEDIINNILLLGKLTGKDLEASRLANEYAQHLKELKASRALANKRVLVVFSAKPLMLFCGKNLIDSSLAAMGAINACTASEQTPIVSTEFIASAKADYIIYLSRDEGEFLKLPLMDQISQHSRVVSANSSALLRASNQIIPALYELQKALMQ